MELGMSFEDIDIQPQGGSPIHTLASWYAAQGWAHERVGEEEIVAATEGAWGQYELRGIWREDDRVLQFLAFPDVTVQADKFGAIYETLGLINEQMWLGHFELWSGNGAIVFRHATLLESQDGPNLDIDQADALIDSAVGELDRFYPVFQFVLWGGKSPSEAITAAMVETQGEA
jgi:hypothetical protein